MIIAGLWRYGDWRHVATGCNALVSHNIGRTTPTVSIRSPIAARVSVQPIHEDTHDHADICTAHGTAVERNHSVRATLAKRACPPGTSANPSLGATRHETSQQSAGSSAAAAAGYGAVEVVAVDAADVLMCSELS